MKTRTISNRDDVIDSRDVISRIQELESERESFVDDEPTYPTLIKRVDEWDEENAEELKNLKLLAEEGDHATSDWPHGATLIRESYFVEYCQELVSDIGDMPKTIPSYIEIDWDKTADNLKVDYCEVDFGGETYYIR